MQSTPSTACGASTCDGYNPPSNTSAYCAPHCGPSASVKSFSRATWGYFSASATPPVRHCCEHGPATGHDRVLLGWNEDTTLDTGRPRRGSQHQTRGHQPIAVDAIDSGGAGSLYNGMIAPLLKFPIKGAVWCKLRKLLLPPVAAPVSYSAACLSESSS